MQGVCAYLVQCTRAAVLPVFVLLIAGCGGSPMKDGPPPGSPRLGNIPDAVPKSEPRSRYGNPRSYVVLGKRYYTLPTSRGYAERGIASWYGRKFHGRRTSSGERFDMYAMTAAHKSLPLPTYVLVTNLENGRQAVVRVNDRGPFHANRLIDLSYAAARKLGIFGNGTGFVEVRAVGPGTEPLQMAKVAPSGQAAPAVRPARPIAVEEAPAAELAMNNEPAPLPTQSTPRRVRLFLQAGAFSERVNAERLSDQLHPVAGKMVYVSPIIVDGTPLYRVRIGPLPDVVQADQLTYRILSMGLEAPRIVLD